MLLLLPRSISVELASAELTTDPRLPVVGTTEASSMETATKRGMRVRSRQLPPRAGASPMEGAPEHGGPIT